MGIHILCLLVCLLFGIFHNFQSGSWNGSRNKLDRTLIDDIDLIIQLCSSTHWAERKDGLTSLTQYLSEGKYLTQEQLRVNNSL